MAIEVEILGHKAKIESISSQLGSSPLSFSSVKEDQLVVWLAFDEAVGSVLSFAVQLPAKKYADQAEFLYNVRRRGEKELKSLLESDATRHRINEEKEKRKKALDALAAEAQSLIE